MTTEIDSDVGLILRTLYTWSERENDPQAGRYSLKTEELLQATKLSHERIEDAVTLLTHRAFVNSIVTLGGLQEVAPTAEGRAYFQTRSDTSINNKNEEPTETQVEYEVFLSHSSLDDELAARVKALLDANGIRTFATPSSIPAGKWEPQIETALQQSAYIWVLLTPHAMSQSVWSHHEFGYFYGYRHGRGNDPEGHSCRFLYVEGTELRGLYREIQGVRIDSFDHPISIARTIAKEIGRGFKEPQDPRRTFLVAPWGPSNGAEIENARIAANRLQSVFRFEPSVAIGLDTSRYAIDHGRYDLDRAARNLLRRKQFDNIESGQLILVTSLPYSEPGAALHESDDLNNGLYFLDDAVSSAGKTLAIVSTYIWDRLPDDASIPALAGIHGWRALGPYLLYAYAMVALGQRLDLEYHGVTRGCPFDYNLDVRSIDLFFKGGDFCEDCEGEIARVIRSDSRLIEELGAIRVLLNTAAGVPS